MGGGSGPQTDKRLPPSTLTGQIFKKSQFGVFIYVCHGLRHYIYRRAEKEKEQHDYYSSYINVGTALSLLNKDFNSI